LIHCSNGEINWQIDETNKLQIHFHDSNFGLDGQLLDIKAMDNRFTLGAGAAEFDQCFLNQLQNVMEAIHGAEGLVVPGESGLRSLKAIDTCYSNRKLMDMPWLAEEANLRAWYKESQPK
jgi:hypothetical protein